MEDTSKITKKVANPAATRKAEPKDDGLVTVEYTKKSVHYPGRATVSRTLAETLEKSGKAVIIKI
ncbi:MAG: hypothetical protein IKO09_06295 [Bacteroidales bacterium]|nr:hypothetical protein [Bacteroidales bacterium]